MLQSCWSKCSTKLREQNDWLRWTAVSLGNCCQDKWVPKNYSTTPMKLNLIQLGRIRYILSLTFFAVCEEDEVVNIQSHGNFDRWGCARGVTGVHHIALVDAWVL